MFQFLKKDDKPLPQSFKPAHEPGTKVRYVDAKGKKVKGVIHGVRTYEHPETGIVLNRTYLVDTGGEDPEGLSQTLVRGKDENGKDRTHYFRQPETLELTDEFVELDD